MSYRESGARMLFGVGLEIGALNAPTPLPVGVRAAYVDRLSRTEAAARFPELDAAGLVEVDAVIDLDREGLGAYDAASQDFVIAQMVLDHVADPAGVLVELFRVVRPGGHVVISVPDRRFTAPGVRPSTDPGALIAASGSSGPDLDEARYLPFLEDAHPELVSMGGPKLSEALRHCRERRESIHVWDSRSFLAFVAAVQTAAGIDAELVFQRDGEETGVECYMVWRVHAGPRRALNEGGRQPDTLATEPRRADRAWRPPAAAPGLLLCGMHRSGTSVMAKMLASLGISPGAEDELLAPHAQDNPDGYWERRDVYDAHVGFMAELGLDWDRVAWMSPHLLQRRESTVLGTRLSGILEGLGEREPWLIKDPRLCLLMPVWREVAPDAAIAVAVRHPLSIAASLASSPRGIYPTRLSLLLWQKYMLRLLADLDGRPVLFVSYERLVADPSAELPRILRLLAAQGLPEPPSEAVQRACAVVNSGLHRNRQQEDAGGLMDIGQAQLYEALQEACGSATLVSLDASRWREPDPELETFQRAFEDRLYRAMVDDQDLVRRQLARVAMLSEGIHARLEHRLAAQEAEVRGLQDKLGSRTAQVVDLRCRLSEAFERQTRLRLAIEDGRRERDMLHAQALAHDRAVHSMQSSLSWRVTAPLRWLGSLRWSRALKPSYRFEQALYRLYYRLPGLSRERKQALVLWAHRRLPWLTRHTQSYQLYLQSGRVPAAGPSPARTPRIDAAGAQALLAELDEVPLVSIVMPVWNTPLRWLTEAVDSVSRQYYPHWELCIVDDCSSDPDTVAALEALSDPRIRVHRLERNHGIGAATNEGLRRARGELVGFLDHDDVLEPDALLEMVRLFRDPELDFAYSDEDKLDPDGIPHNPVFKPDYSPDFLDSNNYVCHFLVARTSLVRAVGGLREGFDGAQDFDLVLRLAESARKVGHVAKVLYHWRMIPGSTAADAGAKPYTWEAGRRALGESLARRNIRGEVDLGPYPNTYRIRRAVDREAQVSIVVPFRDQPGLLRTCVESILDRSTWSRFEIVLVDNQSADPRTAELVAELLARDPRVRLERFDQPFNYASLHNEIVAGLQGEYLVLLNNDTEVITPDWIECLLEHAQRPEVAVVGCRLLYPDGCLQHGGVVVGVGSFAGHAHHLLPGDHPGYMARAVLTQNVSAVTFACAMMRRSTYAELGGMDPALAVAYNDVDFCLRARERGKLVVFTPCAELVHHESRTRGGEDDPVKQRRFAQESELMRERHGALLAAGDPYYNRNFIDAGATFHVDPDYVAKLPPPGDGPLPAGAGYVPGRKREPSPSAPDAPDECPGAAPQPSFSILVPVWNTPPEWLGAALRSIERQTYPHWQVCIADDGSTDDRTVAMLEALDDPRIVVRRRPASGGISAASNTALEAATGDFVALLDHDDLLHPEALMAMAAAIRAGHRDILYSDEDKIDRNGCHSQAHFKSDHSPDLLLSQNFICHLLVVRRELITAIGGFRTGVEGSQDHDLLLRLTDADADVHHVPRILYHWRIHEASTAASAEAKPESWEAGCRAVADAVARRGLDATVEKGRFPHTYRVRRTIRGRPKVSIIIPFRDQGALLEGCIGSLLARTEYADFEVVCVNNGSTEERALDYARRLPRIDSRVRVLDYDRPFNYSAINNFAVRSATGEYLVFLNNDTEVGSGEWLAALLEHGQRPEVGAVGARLLYGDGSVQHAGVIVGLGGVAGHAHEGIPGEAPGYFCRAHLIQDVSAVTFACAMTRRELYQELGGLNEIDLPVAFNDVDYCLRLRERGLRTIYTPYAELRHFESRSRGQDDSPAKRARFAAEVAYMQRRHRRFLDRGDPHYNPNFPIMAASFAAPNPDGDG